MTYSVDYKFRYTQSGKVEEDGVYIEAGSPEEAIQKTIIWLGTDINGNDGWLSLDMEKDGLKVYRENVLYLEFFDFTAKK